MSCVCVCFRDGEVVVVVVCIISPPSSPRFRSPLVAFFYVFFSWLLLESDCVKFFDAAPVSRENGGVKKNKRTRARAKEYEREEYDDCAERASFVFSTFA